MSYEDLPEPEKQRLIAWAEDFKDTRREQTKQSDGSVEKAARKYIKARGRRIDIESALGSKIDAFPYRLAELFRARKFTKLSGVAFENPKHMDDMLPTLARITLEETSAERE